MPGSWNTESWPGKKSVHGVVQPKPSLAHPVSPKGQQAAIEEMCAKSTPHSFEAWHSRVRQLTEWRNCIFEWTIYQHVKRPLIHCIFRVLTCVNNCCISSRRINHHGAQLHALTLCLHTQDSLSCLEQVCTQKGLLGSKNWLLLSKGKISISEWRICIQTKIGLNPMQNLYSSAHVVFWEQGLQHQGQVLQQTDWDYTMADWE